MKKTFTIYRLIPTKDRYYNRSVTLCLVKEDFLTRECAELAILDMQDTGGIYEYTILPIYK